VSRAPAAAGALALSLLLGVAACSPQAARAPKTYTVTIAQMAYGPTPSSLRTGDTIRWVNDDILRHTATARDGSFDVELPPKAVARTVITHAGTVDFYCRYHPGMTGRLSMN
jgi:plastocyanin